MLLLDTHTFVWLASNRNLLSSKVFDLMEEESNSLFISSISAIEIGLLSNAGKIDTFGSCADFLFKNLKRFGIHEIPVDVDIALASTQLPTIHRDPFDRIIIATAQMQGMTILTKDRTIPTYPKVKAIWE
jgi:PIN domain nuclease of toxin-antitoxin system